MRPRERAPPGHPATPTTSPSYTARHDRRRTNGMSQTIEQTDETTIEDFLAAVDELRADDTTVRTTAHTSSVSAEGWTLEPATTAAQ